MERNPQLSFRGLTRMSALSVRLSDISPLKYCFRAHCLSSALPGPTSKPVPLSSQEQSRRNWLSLNGLSTLLSGRPPPPLFPRSLFPRYPGVISFPISPTAFTRSPTPKIPRPPAPHSRILANVPRRIPLSSPREFVNLFPPPTCSTRMKCICSGSEHFLSKPLVTPHLFPSLVTFC